MKVAVSGATGFVGSHVLAHLLRKPDWDVGVLVRQSSDTWRIRDLLGRATILRADLDDREGVRGALAAFRPETVVHLAWGGVPGRNRNDVEQVDNIGRSIGLLTAAHEAEAAGFIGLGSQEEYSRCDGAIGEETPVRPTTLYGIAKLSTCLLAERLCGTYEMRFAWLRLFATYGPKEDPAWLIPSVILSLLRRQRPALTDGSQQLDYLYVADVAEAVESVIRSPAAAGVFNVGAGRAEPVRRIVERIRDRIDPSLALGFGEVPHRPDQAMHLEADVQRLARGTGWAPRTSLEEGLDRTVEWYREHAGRLGSCGGTPRL